MNMEIASLFERSEDNLPAWLKPEALEKDDFNAGELLRAGFSSIAHRRIEARGLWTPNIWLVILT